jgi:hypothetical protein
LSSWSRRKVFSKRRCEWRIRRSTSGRTRDAGEGGERDRVRGLTRSSLHCCFGVSRIEAALGPGTSLGRTGGPWSHSLLKKAPREERRLGRTLAPTSCPEVRPLLSTGRRARPPPTHRQHRLPGANPTERPLRPGTNFRRVVLASRLAIECAESGQALFGAAG